MHFGGPSSTGAMSHVNVRAFVFCDSSSIGGRNSVCRFPPGRSLPFFRCSTSMAVQVSHVNGGSHGGSNAHHPWPEWVAFIDRLRIKGYFPGSVSTSSLYQDLDVLKTPCLSFARDRFDIFKSLSRNDIQNVVELGCPSLVRKAVNSGKRLRIYARLDEGEVCGSCSMRNSCDRAYLTPNEEGAARTVDIVRILLFYAVHVHVSGEWPRLSEDAEKSTRKLLKELLELSDTTPGQLLPEPAFMNAKSVVSKSTKEQLNSTNELLNENIEMKRGDWTCPKCSFMNFARNTRCLKCRTVAPKRTGVDSIEMKMGDWNCSRSSKSMDMWDQRRLIFELEKGFFQRCGFMNFASKKNCLLCRQPRPWRALNPGDWECPACDFVNFKRNMVCLKCNHERRRVDQARFH